MDVSVSVSELTEFHRSALRSFLVNSGGARVSIESKQRGAKRSIQSEAFESRQRGNIAVESADATYDAAQRRPGLASHATRWNTTREGRDSVAQHNPRQRDGMR
jgi:hypothetical protein